MSPYISQSLAQTRVDDFRRLAPRYHTRAREPRLRWLVGRLKLSRPMASRRPAIARP